MYFCFTDYWFKSNNQLDGLTYEMSFFKGSKKGRGYEIEDANHFAFKIMSENLKHLALGMSFLTRIDFMITTAIQRGSTVYVYEKTKILFTRPGELVGFTGTTVSIKRNRIVYVYNERGGIISTHAV